MKKYEKKALIIGGFCKAVFLAESLREKGYQVAIVNSDKEDSQRLAKLTKIPVTLGDGSLPEILKKTNMENADFSITLMPKDEDNFVASVLCKKMLKVKKVITVLEDAEKLELFYKMGIDSVICETELISNALEQQDFLEGIAKLVPISGGRVTVVEVPIYESAPIVNKKLWEIELPSDVIVGCVLRKEHSIVPRGDTRILAGDTLILIASEKQETLAVRNLTGHYIGK